MKSGLMKSEVKRQEAGFTLLEILLVVVIIGILAAAIIPNLAGRSQQARIARVRQDIAGGLGTGLAVYEQDVGTYPTTEQGLDALVAAPPGVKNWHGPYLTTGVVPKDPWGNAYVYRFPGEKFPALYDLVSPGPDGQLGTEDDISNHPEEE